MVVPLTDAQWVRTEPLLPDRTPRRGGRWRDHRQVIDAIAWKFRTGSPWVHLPAGYGSWKGVHTRLRNRAIDGTRARVFTALLARADAEGDLDRVVSVDSTIVRAPQSAAGAAPEGAPADEPDHHALGRSRGGLTTKIHLATDGRCRPLCFHLTPGQAGDAPAFEHIMAALRVPRPVGRPPAFDREAYKQRNTVERCTNRLKTRRGLATRYEKTATVFQAGLHIAGILICSAR
ncbi:IS5 family transposase [Kitasatospora sp. NPDC018619]|uniref:IS5 family transposase n=1 Tax=unclassified Kitasatospora TaxID=2633591 RepID=UPI003799961D